MNIHSHFSGISDPRVVGRTKHLLIDIIGIAIIAVIAECDEWQDISDWAKSKETHLRKYFALPNGIPSHDTFERTFSNIRPDEFEHCFIAWVKSIFGTNNKFVHIDGKSLTGSQDEVNGKKMLHLVGAWASEKGILLGQLRTEEKSNEITAIPELLKMLDVQGSIVTIDAMGCQKEIAEKIIESNADYILGVKGNQKSLRDEIQTAFKHQSIADQNETIEKDHRRIETRSCRVINNLSLLEETDHWLNCKSIIEMQRKCLTKEKQTQEIAYYISSLQQPADFMNQAIRKHWSIENQCHWTLDVSFNEDLSRKRKKNEAENFAILRRIALNVVKSYKGDNRSIRRRRKMASYEFEYLEDILKF